MIASAGRVIDLADLDWCWGRLRGASRGLLSSRSPQRPISLDVGYTLGSGQVAIAIASDHEALHLLVSHEVTLGLTGRTPDGLRWVVRLTGVAGLAVGPASPSGFATSRDLHPARGVVVEPSCTLLLPVYRLRGFHETLLDDVDDVPAGAVQ